MKKQLPGAMFNAFQKKKKNWIAGAIKKPGALHTELGVPQGKKIPAGKLASAAKKGGKEGKRARLAETLKSFHKGKKKKTLRSPEAVVKSEQNASHQFTKKGKKHKMKKKFSFAPKGIGSGIAKPMGSGGAKQMAGGKSPQIVQSSGSGFYKKNKKHKMACKKHKKMNCKDCSK